MDDLPLDRVVAAVMRQDGVSKELATGQVLDFLGKVDDWMTAGINVADLFVDDFKLDDGNREKVTLTTADGFQGPDPAMVDYYFGNLESRRVTWNIGRDLQLQPRQAGGPINALPKAYVEADGVPLKEKEGWNRKLTFKQKS